MVSQAELILILCCRAYTFYTEIAAEESTDDELDEDNIMKNASSVPNYSLPYSSTVSIPLKNCRKTIVRVLV